MRFLSLFFVGFVSVNGMEANKFCACLSKLFSKTTSVSLSYKEIQNQMKNLQGSLEEQSKKASFSAQKTEDLERKNKQLDSFVDGWIEKYNNSVFALGERDETIKDLQKDLEKKEGELIKLLTIIEELKQYNDQLEKDLAKSKTKINEAETEYEENTNTLDNAETRGDI